MDKEEDEQESVKVSASQPIPHVANTTRKEWISILNHPWKIFMFAPCISSIKTLFIVPTDAHYYKIIEMLKQLKIIILAATCFGSRRNHHQGAVLCLAKSTKWFFGAHRYRRSQCYGGISACCAGVRFTVETGTAYLHNRLPPDYGSCVNRNMSEQVL
jgi:hypothetical protein